MKTGDNCYFTPPMMAARVSAQLCRPVASLKPLDQFCCLIGKTYLTGGSNKTLDQFCCLIGKTHLTGGSNLQHCQIGSLSLFCLSAEQVVITGSKTIRVGSGRRRGKQQQQQQGWARRRRRGNQWGQGTIC